MGSNSDNARAALFLWLKAVDDESGERGDSWYEPVLEVVSCLLVNRCLLSRFPFCQALKHNGVAHKRDLVDGDPSTMVQMADRKRLAGAHDSFIRRAIRLANEEAGLSRKAAYFRADISRRFSSLYMCIRKQGKSMA